MIVSARAVTPAPRPIQVRLQSRGSRARVEVVDEGETVPEGLREMLFDAAGAVDVRAHHRALSRGIGPVFCKRVAEAHGGDAGVEPAEKTSEGRGNVFWLELPLGSAPNAP
jgi:signal transduction histidine kinase